MPLLCRGVDEAAQNGHCSVLQSVEMKGAIATLHQGVNLTPELSRPAAG
ncbi:MAG: hypothetical protein WBG38_11775 [Nodosilinea sp.]